MNKSPEENSEDAEETLLPNTTTAPAAPPTSSDIDVAATVDRVLSQVPDLETLDGDAQLMLRTAASASPSTMGVPTLRVAPLSRSVDTAVGAASPPSTGPAPGLPPGPLTVSRGGEFHLIRELGRGGMGVVYAGRQNSLAREIAIKMVRAEHASSELMRRRFVSEALITAELDHPNIVPVHELATGSDGELFVGMKLVRGTSWDELLGRSGDQTSKLRDHLEILLKVCDAVAFAHSRHIVHRDLKPANVMVGAFGEVLVMDWGIALDVSEPGTREVKTEHRSSASGLGGTPCYMAPEQAAARLDQVGFSTDVYLLGAILYQILTGTPPHRGKTLREVLQASVGGHVEPPRERAPDRDVPDELAAIALRAMHVDPAQRHRSTSDLALALRAYLGHEESIRLARDASRHIENLSGSGLVPRADRYASYARALSHLNEALHLWPENQPARVAQAQASLAYAEEALDRGDLGLAASQLHALDDNSQVDAPRLMALEAAVGAAQSFQTRVIGGLIACLLLVFVGTQSLLPWVQSMLGPGESQERLTRRTDLVADGLSAVQAGRMPELLEKRRSLDLAEYDLLADTPRARATLLATHAALLWSQERWADLLDVLVEPLADAGARSLTAQLLADPAVQGSSLAARLDRVRPTRLNSLWKHVSQAAHRGCRLTALERAVELLSAAAEFHENLTSSAATKGAARLIAPLQSFMDAATLRRAAVWAQAHQCAIRAHDLDAQVRIAPRLRRYTLSADPLAVAARAATTTSPPDVQKEAGGWWAAFDTLSGKEIWRSPALLRSNSWSCGIPTETGTTVACGEGQVVSLDTASGMVRARRWLEGSVVVAWPDPAHPDTLVALVALDGARGRPSLVRLREGRVQPAPLITGVALRGHVSATVGALTEHLRSEARKAIAPKAVSGTTGDDPLSVRQATLAGLLEALERDPSNGPLALACLKSRHGPDVLSRVLGAPVLPNLPLLDLPAPWTASRLADIVVACEDVSPVEMTRLAVGLESIGLTEPARKLALRARNSHLDAGANVDLSPGLVSGSVIFMRNLGGRLFEAGQVDRALELIREGRWMASYVEGDHALYLRWRQWLVAQGKSAEAAALNEHVAASEVPGGFLMLPGWLLLLVDALTLVVALMPIAAMLLGLRLMARARSSRIEDLAALGIRSCFERWMAFVTRPVERLRHTFLAYATRSQRAVLVACGFLFLGCSTGMAVATLLFVEVAGLPQDVGTGNPGNVVFEHVLEERVRKYGEKPWTRELRVEVFRQRRDASATGRALKAILDESPDDGAALNNRAVLAEESGNLAEARRGYEKAATGVDHGAAAARFNRARLDGDQKAREACVEALAWRDQVNARRRPQAALWAHAPFEALHGLLTRHRNFVQNLRVGLLEVVSGRLWSPLVGLQDSVDMSSILIVIGSGMIPRLLVLSVALAALLALPFGVRPLVTDGPGEGYRSRPVPAVTGFKARATAVIVRVMGWRHLAAAAVGLFVPGLWDVVAGSMARGSLKFLMMILAIATLITAEGQGVMSQIVVANLNRGYFPEVTETMTMVSLIRAAWAAKIFLSVFLVVNLGQGLRHWKQRLADVSRPIPSGR